MSDEQEDPIFGEAGFGTVSGLAVKIMDLSGANGSDPVEVVRGFDTIAHANAFARRYVRDSVDRCRTRGMDAAAVLEAWFAWGEDAEVAGAGDDANVGAVGGRATGIHEFAARRAADAEDRDWRILDPRRDGDDEDEEEEA